MSRPTVVFVGGHGRIGSTILDRLLGEFDDAVSTGELRHFWDRGVRDDELCQCEVPFSVCPFWSEVVAVGFGSLEELRAGRPWELSHQVDRLSSLPAFAHPRLMPKRAAQIAGYVELTGQLIGAVLKVSGKTHLVDSSKFPVHGYVLAEVPGVDLKMVHAVRDSRAVAFSWTRKRPRPEVHWETAYVPRHSPARSALAWEASNDLIAALARRGVPTLIVRYEDFIRDPGNTIEELATFLDLTLPPKLLSGHTLYVGSGHIVAGNPLRFVKDELELRIDDEWRSALSTSQRWMVSMLSAPGMARYGYFGSGSVSETASRG